MTQKTVLGLDLKGGIELVYQGEPSPQTPHVTQDALNRAVDIMRSRVDQLGVSEPSIQTTGSNLITVGLPDVHDVARAEREVGQTAQLHFYDWEANALTPNGKTVASLSSSPRTRPRHDQPGRRRSARACLARAACRSTRRRSSRPSSHRSRCSKTQSRKGPAYYLFGAPGSAACAAAAKANGTTPVQGQHCLLAGPDSSLPDLYQALPAGVTKADGRARDRARRAPSCSRPPTRRPPTRSSPSSPNAQYFVLKDNVALSGTDITNPQPSTDQTGSPDVTFGFNGKGQSGVLEGDRRDRPPRRQRQPRRHHAQPALRGGAGQPARHRPADQLQASTPTGSSAAAALTSRAASPARSASDLATQLRLGALPINLKRISERRSRPRWASRRCIRA